MKYLELKSSSSNKIIGLTLSALAMALTAIFSNWECGEAVENGKLTRDKSNNDGLREKENILTECDEYSQQRVSQYLIH